MKNWNVNLTPKIAAIGDYIRMEVGERLFLGEVLRREWSYDRGDAILQVKHFNGDRWPFDPAEKEVEVIQPAGMALTPTGEARLKRLEDFLRDVDILAKHWMCTCPWYPDAAQTQVMASCARSLFELVERVQKKA